MQYYNTYIDISKLYAYNACQWQIYVFCKDSLINGQIPWTNNSDFDIDLLGIVQNLIDFLALGSFNGINWFRPFSFFFFFFLNILLFYIFLSFTFLRLYIFETLHAHELKLIYTNNQRQTYLYVFSL